MMRIFSVFLCAAALAFPFPASTQAQSEEAQIAGLIGQGSYAQAFTRLQALKTNAPSGSQYYTLTARLCYDMNSFPEALSNIYTAIKLAPKNATNFLIMGNTLRRMGRYAEARNMYNKGLEIDAGYGQMYFESAQLSFMEQKLAEADRTLKLSENFNPGSWGNKVLSAKLLLVRGQTNEAERAFLNAAAAFPQDAPVLQELSDFYASQRKFDKASAVLKEAELRFGESVSRAQQIGDYAFQRGAYAEALRYYQRVKTLFGGRPFSGSALVSWRLYQLCLLDGNFQDAETNLRASFEQNPANQLYIAAFSQFLAQSYPPGNSYRAVMAQFLEKLSAKEQRLGYGTYYLSLIHKWALLDPLSVKPYQELLNYAKIQKDESLISPLLEALAKTAPENTKAQASLRLRKHLSATGRLNDKPRRLYTYKALLFVEDSVYQSAEQFRKEAVFYNPLFPKLAVETSSEPFSSASRELFRSGSYGLAIHAVVRNAAVTVNLFDKNGGLIQSLNLPYSPENFTKDLLALLKNIHDRLVPVAYLDQRLPNNVFRIGIGANDGLKAGDILSVQDQKFGSAAQMNVVEALPYSATAVLAPGKPASLGGGEGYYVFPFNIQGKINPALLFVPEGASTLNLDPFDSGNKSLENLRL